MSGGGKRGKQQALGHSRQLLEGDRRLPRYPALGGNIETETVIVGGGIVGLTAAYQLALEGRSVVVLEGLSIGGQVTGGSSAKITAQHRLIYRYLIDTVGADRARAYAEANATACATIRRWIAENDMDCDLETRAAYTYATEEAQAAAIQAEAQAARTLGLAADVLDRAPLPFGTGPALCFPDQAQFNPAAYLVGLALIVTGMGVRLFERSRARTIEEGDRWRVITDEGEVRARNIVVATNLTVKSPVGMASRTRPRSHPVLGFRIEDPGLIDGMFITADDPTHSFRTGRDGEGSLLLSLGPRFDTGQVGDVAALFTELESWTRRHFQVGETVWRWCNEDYDTPDRIPCAGEPDPEGLPGFHIATGFNAWGISNGTAAGLLIAGSIAGRDHFSAALYDPTRPAPEGFNPGGDSRSRVAGPDAIAPGSGGVFEAARRRSPPSAISMGPFMPSRRTAPTRAARSPGTTPTAPGLPLPWLGLRSGRPRTARPRPQFAPASGDLRRASAAGSSALLRSSSGTVPSGVAFRSNNPARPGDSGIVRSRSGKRRIAEGRHKRRESLLDGCRTSQRDGRLSTRRATLQNLEGAGPGTASGAAH